MIVVAIIGILAAVALPSYQTYIAKAKMTEVILAAASCRTVVAEGYQTGTVGAGPGGGNWGCESSGSTKYVKSVTTNGDGLITVTMNAAIRSDLDDKTVTLTPYIGDVVATVASLGSVITEFKCGASTDVVKRYLPGSCRAAAIPAT